jgi:hypothetical protein
MRIFQILNDSIPCHLIANPSHILSGLAHGSGNFRDGHRFSCYRKCSQYLPPGAGQSQTFREPISFGSQQTAQFEDFMDDPGKNRTFLCGLHHAE